MANPYIDKLIEDLKVQKQELEWRITEAQKRKVQLTALESAKAAEAQSKLMAVDEAITKIEAAKAELDKL